jgi:hypothetical protein
MVWRLSGRAINSKVRQEARTGPQETLVMEPIRS